MDPSEISATLKYGKFIYGRRLNLLKAAMGVSLLLPIVTIIIIIQIALKVFFIESDMLVALILGNLFSLFLFVICNYFRSYHNRINREIIKWLADAVYVKAKVFRVDTSDPGSKPFQVGVEFSYNEQIKNFESQTGNYFTGFPKIFLRFIGDIEILYSPEYDQVIFTNKGRRT